MGCLIKSDKKGPKVGPKSDPFLGHPGIPASRDDPDPGIPASRDDPDPGIPASRDGIPGPRT